MDRPAIGEDEPFAPRFGLRECPENLGRRRGAAFDGEAAMLDRIPLSEPSSKDLELVEACAPAIMEAHLLVFPAVGV